MRFSISWEPARYSNPNASEDENGKYLVMCESGFLASPDNIEDWLKQNNAKLDETGLRGEM